MSSPRQDFPSGRVSASPAAGGGARASRRTACGPFTRWWPWRDWKGNQPAVRRTEPCQVQTPWHCRKGLQESQGGKDAFLPKCG